MTLLGYYMCVYYMLYYMYAYYVYYMCCMHMHMRIHVHVRVLDPPRVAQLRDGTSTCPNPDPTSCAIGTSSTASGRVSSLSSLPMKRKRSRHPPRPVRTPVKTQRAVRMPRRMPRRARALRRSRRGHRRRPTFWTRCRYTLSPNPSPYPFPAGRLSGNVAGFRPPECTETWQPSPSPTPSSSSSPSLSQDPSLFTPALSPPPPPSPQPEQDSFQEWTDKWQHRDDASNFAQKHDVALVKQMVRPDVSHSTARS